MPFEVLSFPRSVQTIEVDPAAPSYQLEVNTLTKESVDRTYNVEVIAIADIPTVPSYPINSDGTVEADNTDFSLSSTTVTIPAGETKGFIPVSFTAANLADGLVKAFALKIVVPEDAKSISRKDIALFKFTKKCEGTKAELTINFDNYPDETSWELYLGSELVASGGPYNGATEPLVQGLCLAPGDYTFVLYDSYGDGICCASGSGSYNIKVGADIIISGAPSGVGQEIKEFTIN